MEIYSARINFRLSFARPPTNLPLHEIEISTASKVPSLRGFPLPFSPTIYSGNGTKDYHRSGPSLPLIFSSSFSFYLILFLLSRCILFTRNALGSRFFRVLVLRQKPDPVHGFFTCTNVSYLTYLRVEKIRGVEKTSYYYAQISHERGRGKNFA